MVNNIQERNNIQESEINQDDFEIINNFIYGFERRNNDIIQDIIILGVNGTIERINSIPSKFVRGPKTIRKEVMSDEIIDDDANENYDDGEVEENGIEETYSEDELEGAYPE